MKESAKGRFFEKLFRVAVGGTRMDLDLKRLEVIALVIKLEGWAPLVADQPQ